ncbi:MAG: hypothetical protein JW795_11585, partial [Chitinivibrionales bacterium]|nr:hypothetical protein [Chitinivibrionales bacterium]
FDYGSVRGYSLPDAVDVRIAELPLRHPYFEFWTLGFVAKALSLLGACQVCTTCIQSFEKKDSQIQYRFHYQRPKD